MLNKLRNFSKGKLAGVLVGIEEGLEVNVAGLNFGLNPLDLAIRLPGVGRLGFVSSVKPRVLAAPEGRE